MMNRALGFGPALNPSEAIVQPVIARSPFLAKARSAHGAVGRVAFARTIARIRAGRS